MEARKDLFYFMAICCSLIAVVSACVPDENVSFYRNPYQVIVTNSSPVVITNNTQSTKEFDIVINQRSFYSSSDHIIRDGLLKYGDIRDTTGLSIIQSIWLNLAFKVVHNSPFTPERWQHNPVLFLNSVGNGLCDDVANVSEALWRYAGFPARTWFLDGHVVSEVYHKGKWKMFDANLGYYCLANDTILSVTEIADRDGVLLNKQYRRTVEHYNPELSQSANKWYWESVDWNYINGLWQNFKYEDHYKPKEDTLTYSYRLKLPPGAEYVFGKNLTPLSTSFEFPSPNLYNLIFKCSQITDYTINLFLVPIHISGTGYVRINGQRHNLEDMDNDFFHQADTPIREIHIEDATDLEISYLVNGYVFDLFEKEGKPLRYSVALHGENLNGIDINARL